jgi:wobble nucleotide-excising tRNase
MGINMLISKYKEELNEFLEHIKKDKEESIEIIEGLKKKLNDLEREHIKLEKQHEKITNTLLEINFKLFPLDRTIVPNPIQMLSILYTEIKDGNITSKYK